MMSNGDGTRPAWSRLLGGQGMPKDPAERVEWMLAQPGQRRDHVGAALLQVLIHSTTALRLRRSALDALAEVDEPSQTLRVLGDASMAVLALYLAAEAAQRHCRDLDEPGPLGQKRLDALVSTTEQLRDCVMHWRDKARHGSPARFNVTDHDVLAVGTGRNRSPSTIAGLTWRRFESDADRLRRWAEYKLVQRLDSRDAGSTTGSVTDG